MKNLIHILAIAALMLSSTAISQNRIINKNYNLTKESLKIALIPINYTNPEMSDELLGNVFKSDNGNMKTIDPKVCRELLDSDTVLTSFVNRLIEKNYKYRHLKKCPNLSTVLSQEEMDYLKTHLWEADLMLVPMTFEITSSDNNSGRAYTSGNSNFRLYDLNSGEFIFDFSHQLSFPKGGYEGQRGMTTALLVVSQKFFKDQVLDKFAE